MTDKKVFEKDFPCDKKKYQTDEAYHTLYDLTRETWTAGRLSRNGLLMEMGSALTDDLRVFQAMIGVIEDLSIRKQIQTIMMARVLLFKRVDAATKATP